MATDHRLTSEEPSEEPSEEHIDCDAECAPPSDDAIRDLAREALRTSKTSRAAAKKLGVSREATLGLAAGAAVRPATFALIRERIARGNALTTSHERDAAA